VDRLAPTLMLQGTSSSVGKSYLSAGLCRLYARRGLNVAPFKSQNMALNSAVTPDGAEIGRAQAVQADAARVPSEAAMNPILLKAEGDSSCQVVVMGRPIGSFAAGDYRKLRASLWPTVVESLEDLRRRFDLVVIEGAGSPAEVNLREGEIVNMSVARAAKAPVLLVGDIERGGVFAALLGTLDLLTDAERGMVRGLVVNRFRGDRSLFTEGVGFLEERSHLPVLGVVPWLDVRLPAEDSLDLEHISRPRSGALLDIAILELGRISNFDELEPLAAEPGVSVRLVSDAALLGQPDLVILPGSKTTVADLRRLRENGLADAVLTARAAGSAILGICGGYQMLGGEIRDPERVESGSGAIGLGLLPTVTTFEPAKVTARRHGRALPSHGLLGCASGVPVSGYEIRMGRVGGSDRPALDLEGTPEGAVSEDGWTVGTSVHGLLAGRPLRRAVLEALAHRKGVTLPPPGGEPPDPFDRLAGCLEESLDVAALDRMVGL
jgi:adenosylcobyric acid synthase